MPVRRSVLGALIVAAGCAALPDAGELSGGPDARKMDVLCRERLDESALATAVGNGPQLDFVRRVACAEAVVARTPLVPGNHVTLLKDGPQSHKAQLAAIEQARHHVHMDFYIFDDGKLGNQYADLLTRKAREGVEVRVMLDDFGGRGAPAEFRERLRRGGVKLHAFHSVNPLEEPRVWRVTRRNHRKILVVDGEVAFTGGININDDYSGPSSPSAGNRPGWRDTHIRIQGPAVAELQRVFLAMWEEAEGPVGPHAPYYPALKPAGEELVRIVTDRGNDLVDHMMAPLGLAAGRDRKRVDARIYAAHLIAIREARQRIWITQAYFAPDDEFIDALVRAARRGVDVRILMPGRTDVGMLISAARHNYQSLLDAGVRLYEEKDAVIHAKTAVVDGVWATVGSANLDYLSFIHNDEANAVVLGRRFGEQMERMFEDDIRIADEIDPARWARRPFWQKMKERMAAGLKFFL